MRKNAMNIHWAEILKHKKHKRIAKAYGQVYNVSVQIEFSWKACFLY